MEMKGKSQPRNLRQNKIKLNNKSIEKYAQAKFGLEHKKTTNAIHLEKAIPFNFHCSCGCESITVEIRWRMFWKKTEVIIITHAGYEVCKNFLNIVKTCKDADYIFQIVKLPVKPK